VAVVVVCIAPPMADIAMFIATVSIFFTSLP
jgi:hypothetical protein